MRSLLFVPGDSPRKLSRGFASAADAVIVDLEDSVAPGAKSLAREMAVDAMHSRPADARQRLFVRVNALGSELIEADLDAVMPCRPDGIMLPKAEGLPDIERLSAMLRVCEAACGSMDGATHILPIVTETPAGVFSAGGFGRGHDRLCGLSWGAEDLSAAIGARTARNQAGRLTGVFMLARAVTLLAASAAQVPAIDTVFVDFRDAEGLKAECLDSERDGFTGKLAIHPDQIATINAAFTPSSEAVDEARSIVEAFAKAEDAGVVSLNGRMLDRPHRIRAERILSRAAQASAGPA